MAAIFQRGLQGGPLDVLRSRSDHCICVHCYLADVAGVEHRTLGRNIKWYPTKEPFPTAAVSLACGSKIAVAESGLQHTSMRWQCSAARGLQPLAVCSSRIVLLVVPLEHMISIAHGECSGFCLSPLTSRSSGRGLHTCLPTWITKPAWLLYGLNML